VDNKKTNDNDKGQKPTEIRKEKHEAYIAVMMDGMFTSYNHKIYTESTGKFPG
jgi:hypothetical protein